MGKPVVGSVGSYYLRCRRFYATPGGVNYQRCRRFYRRTRWVNIWFCVLELTHDLSFPTGSHRKKLHVVQNSHRSFGFAFRNSHKEFTIQNSQRVYNSKLAQELLVLKLTQRTSVRTSHFAPATMTLVIGNLFGERIVLFTGTAK